MKSDNIHLLCLLLLGVACALSTSLNAADAAATVDDAIVTNGDAFFAASGRPARDPKTNRDFEEFNSKYNHKWKSSFDGRAGKVKMLHGFVSKRYGGDPEVVARSFLSEAHGLFGVKRDLSDLKLQKVDKTAERNHTRFQQVVDGVPVEGAHVVVHSNPAGQITMVQNGYAQAVVPVNRDIVPQEVARQIARADLATVVGGNALGASSAEKRIVRVRDHYRSVWRVVTSTLQPRGYWVYKIDAENADILYNRDEVTSLQTGRGRAFVNNAAWFQKRVDNVSLPTMYTGADGFAPGWLWGPHIDVYDDNGNDPYSSSLIFIYNPVTQKDAFDAVHAYYQMNTVWTWWHKTVLANNSLATPSHFYTDSVPVFVNVIGMCNAIYSPDIYGDLSYVPGFAFGNQNSCGAGTEDLVIDNDVVRHEFAHAVMDWSGTGFQEQYGGPVDNYGRSMGEGNADWYAYLYSRDPYMGEVAFYPYYLRTLDNTRMYPRDVDDPSLGVPEEHYSGEIWGGYLYDVYRVLKAQAIPYIYKSSYYFVSAGGFIDGIPDFQDAIRAQAAAEYDLTGRQTSTAKVWGAMASRGINAALRRPYGHPTDYFGSSVSGEDDVAYHQWSFPAVSSVATTGNMLQNGNVHEYVIETTTAGLSMTATVASKSPGLSAARIELYDINGTPLAAVGPSRTMSAVLTYPNLPVGTYVITVSGIASRPARGYYSFKVATR